MIRYQINVAKRAVFKKRAKKTPSGKSVKYERKESNSLVYPRRAVSKEVTG